jgi:glycerol-3-phosphate dehydrogenase (NAD+)
MSDPLKRVAIVGSGNWYVRNFEKSFILFLFNRGSTIAKIVGNNITKFNTFENEVRMYVYEELVDGRKLTEIINEEHENIKYLPGHKFTPNVVSLFNSKTFD